MTRKQLVDKIITFLSQDDLDVSWAGLYPIEFDVTDPKSGKSFSVTVLEYT